MARGRWVARDDGMADVARRRVVVEVPWRTLLKLILAVALVWVWLQIYQLVLLVVVAVLLAVTLDPVVAWVQRRGLPRWGAATVVGVALLSCMAGFPVRTGSARSVHAGQCGERA